MNTQYAIAPFFPVPGTGAFVVRTALNNISLVLSSLLLLAILG